MMLSSVDLASELVFSMEKFAVGADDVDALDLNDGVTWPEFVH